MRERLSKLDRVERERLRLRAAGKVERRSLTDEIQRFNIRDFPDGDKNPEARKRYGCLTAKTQSSIFGIPAGGRDKATGHELALLILSERAMADQLNQSYVKAAPFRNAEEQAIHTAKQINLIFNSEVKFLR